MASHGDDDLSVAAFVDYCRTQARLLSGRLEELGSEADELIEELETEAADLRERLEHQRERLGAASSTPADGDADDLEEAIAETEARQADLSTKQAELEAKQARMSAFEDLAEGYVALADELESSEDDGQEALDRVVEFEADRDAPASFPDRQTVLEAALDASDAEE